tara:strand:+ start:285 stop:728 length:444 start_codon:yes stop_codon:yes gene_type:complete
MANLKISQLTTATALQGDEVFALIQSSTTKKTDIHSVKNYILPTNLTVVKDTTVNLSSYPDSFLIKLTWSGDIGTMVLNLPSAASSTNRTMRIISNGGFATNTRVHLTPIGGDTLDGSTAYYEINKEYEGIKIWSDGLQWFIIQKKG